MADSDDNLTPEQRLLKLIEEQGDEKQEEPSSGGTASEVSKKSAVSIDLQALLSPAAIQENILNLKDGVIGFFKRQKEQLQLKQINALLKGLTIFFGLILIGSALIDMQVLNRDYQSELAMTQSRMTDLVLTEGADIGTPFFAGLEGRNVFAPVGVEDEKEEKVSALTLKILEMTENLRLTGISVHPTDPRRTFCMIEDLEKNITTFLKLGDTISGLRVSEINQDSVILKYQDEVIEIR